MMSCFRISAFSISSFKILRNIQFNSYKQFDSSSDHHIEQTRSKSENLPFSISRLLSKTNNHSSTNHISNNNNNNDRSDRKSVDKEYSDNETGKVNFSHAGLQYNAGLYSYPLYTTSSGGVLRVPTQRGYSHLALHPGFPLHPAAALAVKDRLAGEFLFISNHNLPVK
jgi:hypothetical protein